MPPHPVGQCVEQKVVRLRHEHILLFYVDRLCTLATETLFLTMLSRFVAGKHVIVAKMVCHYKQPRRLSPVHSRIH